MKLNSNTFDLNISTNKWPDYSLFLEPVGLPGGGSLSYLDVLNAPSWDKVGYDVDFAPYDDMLIIKKRFSDYFYILDLDDLDKLAAGRCIILEWWNIDELSEKELKEYGL